MVELYRQFSRKVINDALYPGLRTVFLQLLAQFGEISYNPEADSDEYSVLIADEQAKSRFMASEDYAQLAISICDRTLKIDRPAAEDRHLFVVMANMALSPNRQDYPGSEALKRGMLYDLLQNMTKISRIALDRGWTNCGSYVDLPWIDTLLNGIRNPDHLLPPFIPLIPPAFIDNTEEAIRRGLITGVGIRERFDELVQLWRQDQSAPAADITGSAVAGPSQNPEMQLSSTTGSTRACTTQDIATHVRD
ncbi:hypothetical protein EW026_g1982 [Hermanssonia centrifuga]|uniref:Uncharacterized protein n=1 Tax=Hermanssonia centrifuga TaxID=98765 RepID=A0A4S4KQK2_9APHY|nr:hypothetical protein EW026_g1982 [Hermanssonia centrifuga]